MIEEDQKELIRAIQSCLSDDLLKDKYVGMEGKYRGHCYVASEALYHLLGAHTSKWRPVCAHSIRLGDTHWWLEDQDGNILDPTREQFESLSIDPPYDKGVGKGFLTKGPSKRAEILIQRVLETDTHHDALPSLNPPDARIDLIFQARYESSEIDTQGICISFDVVPKVLEETKLLLDIGFDVSHISFHDIEVNGQVQFYRAYSITDRCWIGLRTLFGYKYDEKAQVILAPNGLHRSYIFDPKWSLKDIATEFRDNRKKLEKALKSQTKIEVDSDNREFDKVEKCLIEIVEEASFPPDFSYLLDKVNRKLGSGHSGKINGAVWTLVDRGIFEFNDRWNVELVDKG